MKRLVHFAKRDFLDGWIGWILISVLTLLAFGWLMHVFHQYAIIVYGAVAAIYFAFSLFQTISFWGGVQNQQAALTRYYLQSLPIPRKTIFWICMARGWVTTLPLGGLALYFPFFIMQQSDWKEVIVPVFTPLRFAYYGLVVFATLAFTPLFACRLATFNQSLRKTVVRTQRFLQYLIFLFIDNLIAIIATFSASAAIPLILNSTEYGKWVSALVLGFAFNALQLWRAYRGWLFD